MNNYSGSSGEYADRILAALGRINAAVTRMAAGFPDLLLPRLDFAAAGARFCLRSSDTGERELGMRTAADRPITLASVPCQSGAVSPELFAAAAAIKFYVASLPASLAGIDAVLSEARRVTGSFRHA